MGCVVITVYIRPQSEVTITRGEVICDHTLPAICSLLLGRVDRFSDLCFAGAILVDELVFNDRWLLCRCLKGLCFPTTHEISLTHIVYRLKSIIVIVARKSEGRKPLLPERRGRPLLCD
jgi:hypothetical protein